MSRALWIIAVMYGFALGCLLLSRWLTAGAWYATLNRYIGTSLGAFATGLAFLLAVSLVFPQNTLTVQTARALARIEARLDSVEARLARAGLP